MDRLATTITCYTVIEWSMNTGNLVIACVGLAINRKFTVITNTDKSQDLSAYGKPLAHYMDDSTIMVIGINHVLFYMF